MSVYQSIFDIITTHIYGNPEVLTSDMTLIATLMASIGSVFVFSVPFLVIFWLLRTISGN